jgi:hypothetical protein
MGTGLMGALGLKRPSPADVTASKVAPGASGQASIVEARKKLQAVTAYAASLTDQGRKAELAKALVAVNALLRDAAAIKDPGKQAHAAQSAIAQLDAAVAGAGAKGPVLQAIVIRPDRMTLASGGARSNGRQQFKAMGTFSNNTSRDMSGTVAWVSSNPRLLSIDASGMAQTVVGSGTATITARDPGSKVESPPVTVTVEQPVLVSITISPAEPSLDAHAEQRFTATGLLSDQTSEDVTAKIAWSSSVPGVVSIDRNGLATAQRGGIADVKAADPGNSRVWASTTVTVNELGRPATLDASKVRAVDLSKLRGRMKSLWPQVQAALDAATAMGAAAQGVDLDHPPKAGASPVSVDKRDVEILRNALGLAENTRSDMAHICSEIQDNLDQTRTRLAELKASLPGKLDDGFWAELDKKVGDGWAEAQHVVDASVQVINALKNLKDVLLGDGFLTVLGMDYVKDWLKSLDGGPYDFAALIRELGEKSNQIARYLADQNAKELTDLRNNLDRLWAASVTKRADYERDFANAAEVIDRVSTSAHSGLPPKVAKAYKALLKADMLSKTARALFDKELRDLAEQLAPPGDLVRELPKSDVSSFDMVVYQKGSVQYGYRRETVQSLQALVKQLESVRQVDASGARLDDRLKAWNEALSLR